jgi:PAS domain S-box-containing protein
MRFFLLKKMYRALTKPAAVAAIAFLCLAVVSVVFSKYIAQLDEQKERKDALMAAAGVKHQIETTLENARSASKTLALFVEHKPAGTSYDQICKSIFTIYSGIDGIELGPDGIVRYVYPFEPNKPALGFNIMADRFQKDEAILAVKNKKMHFAGPLNLKQGGIGIVGRQPIFVTRNGRERFWGFSLVVIKIQTLFASAHIRSLDSLGYKYTFTRINPVTNRSEVFFGENGSLDRPVEVDIRIPNSSWKLLVAPIGGWRPGIERRMFFYLSALLSFFVAVIVWMKFRQPERLKLLIEKNTADLEQKNRENTIFAKSSFRLVRSSSEDDVFSVIVSAMRDLLPASITIVMKISVIEQSATVAGVTGLDSGLFRSAASIAGFDPVGKSFQSNEEFISRYCTPSLRRIENGLDDLASSVLPKVVADKIGNLLNIAEIYSIGITHEEHLFGYLHIFQTGNSVELDQSLLETFIHQCSLTLSNIRSHRQVVESEERYRKAILQAKAVPYLKYYDQQRYVFMPDEVEHLTGYPARDMTPALWKNIILEYSFKDELSGIDKQEAIGLIRSGKYSHWSVDYKIVRKDGTIRWIYDSSIQLTDDRGTAYASLGILQDITERKMAEENIKKLNLELEKRVDLRTAELLQTNKELEAFSYSVSHDLRAPLRSIDGFSSMLAEQYASVVDDEGKRLFQVIRSSIHKMDVLIDGLLTLSRIGRTEMIKTEVPMTDEATAVFNGIVPPEQRGAITFTVDPLPPVHADSVLIRQVWTNLISNAVKYSSSSSHPSIHIGASSDGHSVTYFVNDNGAGFNQSNVDKLFGIFQRLHTAAQFPGIGIGLSIVKRIIERHNGRVWAEGKELEGATFYFSLPIAP